MKLKNNEKVILAVLLAVVIIFMGVFLLILPEYNKIEPNKNALASAQSQRDQLLETLAREGTIDAEIKTAMDKANSFSTNFYDELETYEFDMILREYLKDTNNQAVKLSISDYTAKDLTLEEYVDQVVTYPLKEYSGYVEPGVIDVTAYGISYDENGNIVVPENFTIEDTKNLLKDYLSALLTTQTQTIGATTVTFDIRGTRKNYLEFLDYIAKLDKTAHINSAVVAYTKTLGEEREGQPQNLNGGTRVTDFGSRGVVRFSDNSGLESSITITFYSVRPPQFDESNAAA